MYKLINGLVPAIKPQDYFTEIKNKRRIKRNHLDDYKYQSSVAQNIRNNSKCYHVKICNSNRFKNSFFVRTVAEWNTLNDETVKSVSVTQFEGNLAKFNNLQ